MKKWMFRIVIFLFAFALLAGVYLFAGFSGKGVRVVYAVVIENPYAGELEVNMTLYPEGKPYVHLFLRDTRTEDGLSRVRTIAVTRNGKPLPTWRTVPGMSDIVTVWTGFTSQSVEISYVLKADDVKGRKMVSHLEGDFGYLRVMNTLYTPISFKDTLAMLRRLNTADSNSGTASVSFLLPDGWILNSPWDGMNNIRISDLRNVYFGLGDLSLSTVESRVPSVLAVYNPLGGQEREMFQRNISVILNKFADMAGFLPNNTAQYRAVTIVPEEPIFGGASGTASLVTMDDLHILSHEIFHWWNGETVDTTKDANWIKEGFTEYYESKVLLEAGLISAEAFNERMGRNLDIVRQCDASACFDFKNVSISLIMGSNSEQDYDIVYYGGAGIAYALDTKLGRKGKSLDGVWKILYDRHEPISTDIFIGVLSEYGGADLGKFCSDMVAGKSPVCLPSDQ